MSQPYMWMMKTAHFWKSFFHGHQSWQYTSENKKTVVSGLLKVKVHRMERLIFIWLTVIVLLGIIL